jgi:hypothetical protein
MRKMLIFSCQGKSRPAKAGRLFQNKKAGFGTLPVCEKQWCNHFFSL